MRCSRAAAQASQREEGSLPRKFTDAIPNTGGKRNLAPSDLGVTESKRFWRYLACHLLHSVLVMVKFAKRQCMDSRCIPVSCSVFRPLWTADAFRVRFLSGFFGFCFRIFGFYD